MHYLVLILLEPPLGGSQPTLRVILIETLWCLNLTNSFIHLTHFLSMYYVLSTIHNRIMNKTDIVLAKLPFKW